MLFSIDSFKAITKPNTYLSKCICARSILGQCLSDHIFPQNRLMLSERRVGQPRPLWVLFLARVLLGLGPLNPTSLPEFFLSGYSIQAMRQILFVSCSKPCETCIMFIYKVFKTQNCFQSQNVSHAYINHIYTFMCTFS